MDLLKEMRNVKSGGTARADLADTVDGANGEEEIVDKFRDVYSTLYNSSGSQEEMLRLNNRINSLIGPTCIAEVAKLTGAAVKEAASKLKPKKSDVSGGFTSDAILHAPYILFDQLPWLTEAGLSMEQLLQHFLRVHFCHYSRVH